VTSCSHLVVVLAGIESVKIETGIPRARFARRNMPEDKLEFYLGLYAGHLDNTLSSDENIYSWTARQTYIALGNMMTAAAFIGIDSCPIEGFDKEKVEEILNLDTKKYQLSVVLPFGYRVNEQPPMQREAFEDIVEFIR
jgi:nitroreductase